MKRILVPTDFSKNSKIAFQYAMELAQQLEAEVTVVNIYHPSATVVNEYPLPIDTELLQINKERLANFVSNSFDQNMEAVVVADMVEQRMEIGFAAEKLIQLSKTGEFDLIIMGAKGETGLLEKVFGKVSLSVAERASCPVLLIPSGISYAPIKEIMYASNFESLNMNVLLEIEKFSRNLKAKIHLVHVSDQDKDATFTNVKMAFQKKLPALNAEMDMVTSDSVAHGLESYAAEKAMDWMVIVKPHLNFWQRLTHKSQSNPIVMNPKIPLMVMH